MKTKAHNLTAISLVTAFSLGGCLYLSDDVRRLSAATTYLESLLSEAGLDENAQVALYCPENMPEMDACRISIDMTTTQLNDIVALEQIEPAMVDYINMHVPGDRDVAAIDATIQVANTTLTMGPVNAADVAIVFGALNETNTPSAIDFLQEDDLDVLTLSYDEHMPVLTHCLLAGHIAAEFDHARSVYAESFDAGIVRVGLVAGSARPETAQVCATIDAFLSQAPSGDFGSIIFLVNGADMNLITNFSSPELGGAFAEAWGDGVPGVNLADSTP